MVAASYSTTGVRQNRGVRQNVLLLSALVLTEPSESIALLQQSVPNTRANTALTPLVGQRPYISQPRASERVGRRRIANVAVGTHPPIFEP